MESFPVPANSPIPADWFDQTESGVPLWSSRAFDSEKLTSQRIAVCRPNFIELIPTKPFNEHHDLISNSGLAFTADKIVEFVPNQCATLKQSGGSFPIPGAFPKCGVKLILESPFALIPAGVSSHPLEYMGRPGTLSTGARTVAESTDQKDWSPNKAIAEVWLETKGLANQWRKTKQNTCFTQEWVNETVQYSDKSSRIELYRTTTIGLEFK